MKFTVNSADIQRALNKVGGAIPSKSAIPILESMLFDLVNDQLTITATDLDVSLTISIQVKGSEDGRIVVPAKRLVDTIRSLSPEVSPDFSIDTTTNKIRISTTNGEYNFTGESAKEFPNLPQFTSSDEIRLDAASLKRLVHRTAFAVSSDELRPAMMGVLLQARDGDLRAVATDGHRLVQVDQQLQGAEALKRDVIVPARAFTLVARSLESGICTIIVNNTHIKFTFESTQLISRLIDEKYPNYESVIPRENNKEMTIDRESTVLSLRRVALYASATTHQVRFEINKSVLTISAQDVDFGGEAKETMSCEYSHDTMEIGFNSTYVVDILTHLDSQKVVFRFSSPTHAGIVAPAEQKNGEKIIMLVMPVRLNA